MPEPSPRLDGSEALCRLRRSPGVVSVEQSGHLPGVQRFTQRESLDAIAMNAVELGQQPVRRKASCSSVSTPAATTSIRREWARAMIERTKWAETSSVVTEARVQRSSLTAWSTRDPEGGHKRGRAAGLWALWRSRRSAATIPPSMKVRAIAVSAEGSNAIGTLELECTPAGLMVLYVGVGAFSEGYAPAAVTTGTQVTVPWSGLMEARAQGDQVFLALDPRLTPHNRLTLVNFSTGNDVDHRQLYRRRTMVRVAAIAAALVVLLTGTVALPRLGPQWTLGTALLIAVFAATAVLVLGFAADQWLKGGGVDADRAREAFVATLGHYLPALQRLPVPPTAAAKPRPLPPLDSFLPRTTGAVAITLAAGTLGAVLMARWLTLERSAARERSEAAAVSPVASMRASAAVAVRPPPRPVAAPSPAPATSSPPAAAPPAPGHGLARGTACTCTRADSVLWREPIPELSTLIIDSKVERKQKHSELKLEVAAINNGDKAIEELTLRVEFYEQDPPPSSKLYSVANRPLYFAGPLGPGKAIKWSVEADGTHFKVHPPAAGAGQEPITGDIGAQGERAAPTNLLADLLNANHRPVRLHGAMLLAFLGDPRAQEAAQELRRALRDEEATYLRRLFEALGDVRGCELSVAPSGQVSVCAFNASRQPKGSLGVQLRALDAAVTHRDPVGPPPQVLEEYQWAVPGELAPGTGVRLTGTVAGTPQDKAAMYEIVIDRMDLLN